MMDFWVFGEMPSSKSWSARLLLTACCAISCGSIRHRLSKQRRLQRRSRCVKRHARGNTVPLASFSEDLFQTSGPAGSGGVAIAVLTFVLLPQAGKQPIELDVIVRARP